MARRTYGYDNDDDWPPPNYQPNHGSGYRITLQNFKQLIEYPPYQDLIARRLSAWFGYDLVGERDVTVRASDGTMIDLLTVHERIQSDPKMQFWFYQAAMSLRR